MIWLTCFLCSLKRWNLVSSMGSACQTLSGFHLIWISWAIPSVNQGFCSLSGTLHLFKGACLSTTPLIPSEYAASSPSRSFLSCTLFAKSSLSSFSKTYSSLFNCDVKMHHIMVTEELSLLEGFNCQLIQHIQD